MKRTDQSQVITEKETKTEALIKSVPGVRPPEPGQEIFGYVRVSTIHQAEDMLTDLAVREGITETAVVEDLIYKSHENLLQVPVDYVVDALFARLNPILNNLLSSERQSERYGNIAVEMLNSMVQNMTVQSSSRRSLSHQKDWVF